MQYGRSTSWARSLPLLTTLVSATVVVAILRLARPVLMPIAFASFLAFILTSPMKWLQHRITRIPALALVMLLAVGAIGSATWVLTSQLNELTAQFGTYAESMRRKVTALQDRSGRPFARVDAMLDQVTGGLEKGAASRGAPVRVVPEQATPAAQLWNLVTPLAEPLLTVLFVVVLCIFILGQREDVRNRLIRLIGTANVTLTTRAMDEGAQRITRFLLAQTIINVSFGTIVGVALYFVGLPYAVLWGAVAAIARFIPYLGAMASMLLPAALAFAIFPGWTQLALTVGLFLGLDTITAYAVEPLLIGRRTGVSSIALLISALFWVWLWGPLGLALATPLTVSLVVLGRHVPGLQFVVVLLGDDQVIGTEISFYQRLLARDDDEAGEVVRANLASLGPVGVMDKILIPALVLAARDESRREITDEDETFIVAAARDIFEHLPRPQPTAPASAAAPASALASATASAGSPMRALGIAAYPAQSELLLEMLAAQLAPEFGALEILPRATTPAQAVARVELLAPIMVCIAALPPDGGPFARELCHRLKGRFPKLTVVAFRPDEPGVDPARAAKRLNEAGADLVVTTVAEACAEMTRLLGPAAAATEPLAPGQGGPETPRPAIPRRPDEPGCLGDGPIPPKEGGVG